MAFGMGDKMGSWPIGGSITSSLSLSRPLSLPSNIRYQSGVCHFYREVRLKKVKERRSVSARQQDQQYEEDGFSCTRKMSICLCASSSSSFSFSWGKIVS
jgi:hypothetical protein